MGKDGFSQSGLSQKAGNDREISIHPVPSTGQYVGDNLFHLDTALGRTPLVHLYDQSVTLFTGRDTKVSEDMVQRSAYSRRKVLWIKDILWVEAWG